MRKIYVDMDGTVAEFRVVDTLETLYEEGYFLHLKPQEKVIEAVNALWMEKEYEVFILSAYLTDSDYAIDEKNRWLDKYMPFIDKEHRLFPPCGKDKRGWLIDNGIEVGDTDVLLDDYSLNLHAWEPPSIGIKLMNGINGNFGTWTGFKVDKDTITIRELKNAIDSATLKEPEVITDRIRHHEERVNIRKNRGYDNGRE